VSVSVPREGIPVSAAFAYIGNALDAAGFRLAGVRASAPESGDVLAAFEAAAGCQAVFITPAAAAQLPRPLLEAAMTAARPLVVLVPEDGAPSPLDPAERVRAQLGLES